MCEYVKSGVEMWATPQHFEKRVKWIGAFIVVERYVKLILFQPEILHKQHIFHKSKVSSGK